MSKGFFFPALAVVAFLAGCASSPPPETPKPPPPTRVQVGLSMGQDINPDGEGRPSPLLVRVYQLRSVAAFNGADFFDIYQKEKTVLAADLVRKDEFVLRPGEARKLSFEADSDTQVIAAFAAFRNLDTATWRVSAPITPHRLTAVDIRVDRDKIALTAVPVPEAPPAPQQEK